MTTRQRSDVVDATGTRRRLEALAALGHTARTITATMGRTTTAPRALVSSWRRRDRRWIDARTAADVAQVYELLAAQLGTNTRLRIESLRSGCLPPVAWVGHDIDDPTVHIAVDDPTVWPRTATTTAATTDKDDQAA
jgi:hypothetical protein